MVVAVAPHYQVDLLPCRVVVLRAAVIFPGCVETGQCLHQSAGVISFHEPEAAGAAGDEDRGTVVYRAGSSVKMILLYKCLILRSDQFFIITSFLPPV